MHCEAHNEREERQMEKMAWAVSHVMNCWVKKGKEVTPEKLLGKKKKLPSSIAEEDLMIEDRRHNARLDFLMKGGSSGDTW